MAEKLIGKVTHYFNNLQVAVVKADKGSLAVGETVKFKHGDKEFVQTVDSLQVDKEPVKKIKKGEEAGLKVAEPVKEGWEVYQV